MRSFDLQVNGYAGADFNSENLTADELRRACERLDGEGSAGVLATVITDDVPSMCRRLAHLVALRQQDDLAKRIIAGLHVEGPFLSGEPGFVGAHPKHAVCPANVDDTKRLLEAGGGLVRLFTLAPEHDENGRVTAFLADQEITVSAGHCNPSLDQLRAAIDSGLSMFTHLGNACPGDIPRHDNIIQRVLFLRDRLTLCFIADGAHVPFFALRNYLDLAGYDRTVIVTDAISAAGCGPGTYSIGDQTVEIGEDLVPWAPDRSHLMGSAVTMTQTESNLREHLALDEHTIARLLYENPRRSISLPP